jgi:hypothetical protein
MFSIQRFKNIDKQHKAMVLIIKAKPVGGQFIPLKDFCQFKKIIGSVIARRNRAL